MRKFIVCCTTALLLCITGCSSSNTYTQKETPLILEVNQSKEDADKLILEGILRNDKTLKDEDKESLTLNYDEAKLKSLNTFEIIVKNKDDAEIIKVKAETKDTTKPKVELTEKELERGADIKKLIKVSDNYDDEETLLKTLNIEGYSDETIGTQEITIRVEDSSKNQTELKTEIIVKEDVPAEDTSNQNANQSNSNSYTANGGSNSSNGTGSSGKSTYHDEYGNEITEEQYYEMIEEANKPVAPNYACPTVPHYVDANGVEVWEGNPDLPCDWTPYPLGNTGLLFETEDEVWQYAFSQGWGPAEITIHYIHYNGGYTKYSLSYRGS